MSFPELGFRHSWRPYQQRVLDAIDEHLEDKRLHIVAAPGAGKTTLGLEVFNRLQKSALVLSPTRIIRDQWLQRLNDFIATEENPDDLAWTSKQLLSPGKLTSITYQALHSHLSELLLSDEEEVDALEDEGPVSDQDLSLLIKTLTENDIQVLILDEAHHLRDQWWRALDKVCEALPDIILVALTATPPYDSQNHEWGRYEQLCGPIDEEISVPELVKAGTLCPHQDYVWAVNLSGRESDKIKAYDEQVKNLCDSLYSSEEFEQIVLSHPWLAWQEDTEYPEAEVIKEPELAIALLVFAKQKARPLSPEILELLDLKDEDIPELGRHYWQVLVAAVLFSNTFTHSEQHKEFISSLKKQMRASELLYKRSVSIEHSKRLWRSLSQSLAKVKACSDIHAMEYKKRGQELRQVVLLDYIRDEHLGSELDTGSTTLGAWPVFKQLLQTSPIKNHLALLTGRLSCIHEDLLAALKEQDKHERFNYQRLWPEGPYLKVTGPLNQLTGAFTHLLIAGQIKTLVGTRSLLGEGWDAPVINSLILASNVGSFMLTNQMRGRAIRIDKNKPDKISSIWHLIAVESSSGFTGRTDFNDLKKRFDTFVGLSESKATIESSFDRMESGSLRKTLNSVTSASLVSEINGEMQRRYDNFHQLGQRWQQALTIDKIARVLPSVKTPTLPEVKNFHIRNTLKYLLMELCFAICLVASFALRYAKQIGSGFWLALSLSFVAGALWKLPETIAATRILFKHLPVGGSMRQMGIALVEALCETGLIKTSRERLKVNVLEADDGSVFLALTGSTFYESSLFADCFTELLKPIDKPRYLISRKGRFMGLNRLDYHAVPAKIGVKKELAEVFHRKWCEYVGESELIYTRHEAGRKRLLKVRMQAFSSTFDKEVKRQDRWQTSE